MKDIKINIPQDAQKIIEELEANGFTAYIVGGCVRDAIMGKEPHDYDICTSATPEDMTRIFAKRNVIETGLKHGTLTVKGDKDYYEVTTYRIDGEYLDGRHPESVIFVDNIEADLARRDFTMNAMAYNKKTGLIDPFGGIDDIKNKLIRCVGDADKRFNEDALRIMRAVRFASVCGFDIEKDTKKAMHKNKDLLTQVSAERKTTEFCKMLPNATYALLNDNKDIFATFIPEIKPMFYFEQNNYHHIYDVYSHTAHAVENASSDLTTRLALFFHDIGKPSVYTEDENNVGHFYGHPSVGAEMTENIMRRMKFDTNTIKNVCELVDSHDIEPSVAIKFARKMLGKLGEQQLRRLIEIERADKQAQSVNKDSISSLNKLDVLEKNLEIVLYEQQCVSIKDLAINGKDIMALGVKEGKQVGEILSYLLDKVIGNPEDNTKEILENFTKNYIGNICERV